MRIAVVAPSSCFEDAAQAQTVRNKVLAVAREHHPDSEVVFHPQFNAVDGHFAGNDDARAAALVEVANDSQYQAVWFARGGYGSNRIAERALRDFGPAARDKKWLGYSDAGFLLAGLYARGYAGVAHGPMPKDVLNGAAGRAAVKRSLDWLIDRSEESLEPELDRSRPNLAFNVTVFGMLLGTPLEPRLEDHVLILEEVDEHLYATDRAMFHITGNVSVRGVHGIRRGRVAIKDEPHPQAFNEDPDGIFKRWCGDSGIRYLGAADIGHDSANKVVPFGLL